MSLLKFDFFVLVYTAEVKSCFQECVANFKNTPTLAFLRSLEKKIVDHFKFKDFSQLQQGTFLDFIVQNKKVCASCSPLIFIGDQDSFNLPVTTLLFFQVLQETAGGALSIDNQDPGTYGFRPSRQDVFEFIKQCGEGDVSFQCVLRVERHPLTEI